MAYTWRTTFEFTTGRAGNLAATVRSDAGTVLGSQPAFTFTEIETGLYFAVTAAMPDGQTGSVVFEDGSTLAGHGPIDLQHDPFGILRMANGVETGWTIEALYRQLLGMAAGDTENMETAGVDATVKNPGGTKSRVVATIDGLGNRTSTAWDSS